MKRTLQNMLSIGILLQLSLVLVNASINMDSVCDSRYKETIYRAYDDKCICPGSTPDWWNPITRSCTNEVTFRELSYKEVQKYGLASILVDYWVYYKDLNNDWIKESILIIQDKEAEPWAQDKRVWWKTEAIDNIKVWIFWYDLSKDLWTLLWKTDLEWTLFNSIEFYNLENKTHIFIRNSMYGVSDWSRILDIISLNNGKIYTKHSFRTSITNSWDILVVNDWNKIYEIGKIDWDWGARESAHQFMVHEYIYKNWEYVFIKSRITNNSYDSYNITHTDKIKAILKDVWLEIILID